MTLTADYLRSTGSVLSEQQFVDALRRLAGPAEPPAGAHLSQADESFLAAHGGLGLVDDAAAVSAAAENLVHVARAAVDTLDVEQVAALVGVSESRIRHQIADGALYSFKAGRKRVLPRWQLSTSGFVPGLGTVVRSLPADLHPLAVDRWMTRPNDQLQVEERSLSPREWLVGGGDPAVVAELAQDLGTF